MFAFITTKSFTAFLSTRGFDLLALIHNDIASPYDARHRSEKVSISVNAECRLIADLLS